MNLTTQVIPAKHIQTGDCVLIQTQGNIPNVAMQEWAIVDDNQFFGTACKLILSKLDSSNSIVCFCDSEKLWLKEVVL